ncbi:hypothetical protein GGH98_002237 [Coemansia sp. RSA 454]|nr:hypothetical protein GGH98_002237 [Coemansia sp. RSA 454]
MFLKHFTEEWDDDVKWMDDDTELTGDAAHESGALLPDFPTELKAPPAKISSTKTLKAQETNHASASTDHVRDHSPTDHVPDQPSLKQFSEECDDDDDDDEVKWMDEDIGWADDTADGAADNADTLLPEFPTTISATSAKPITKKELQVKETKQFSISIDRVPDQLPSLKNLSEEWDDDEDVKWTDEDIGWADEAINESSDLLSELPTEITTSTHEPTPKEEPANRVSDQLSKDHVSDQPPSLKYLSEEWDDDDDIGWSDEAAGEAADSTDVLLPEFPTEISTSSAKPIIKKAPKPKRIKHDWTSKELKRLLKTVKQSHDNAGSIDWTKVTSHFPHHTLQSCISVYTKTTGTNDLAHRLSQCKQKMSSEDEQKLVEIICRRGECDWDGVSTELMESTGIAKGSFYLKTLWARRLCPKAQTAPQWTRDRTEQLKSVLKVHGNEPVFLTYRFFPQYTPGMISIMIGRLGTDREALDPRESSIPKVKIQRRRPLHL